MGPDWSGVRHGPLQAGEWVRITDSKGRRHNIRLRTDGSFSTKKGEIAHNDLIGRDEGFVVQSSLGGDYLVFRPLLHEYVRSMPRGAAVVYPKDAAQIVSMADIHPGCRVVEAGAGSGALTCYLLRAVGPSGEVLSVEERADFAAVAERNVDQFFGARHPAWRLRIGDVVHVLTDVVADRVVLDLVDPWACVDAVAEVLVPGGILCCYVATTTQLSRTVETLRGHGGFTEPRSWESMVRDWHVEGLAVRPDHRMVGHTAFLITARRMAPGEHAPRPKRRPAPGAYGPDYTGPRPARETG